MREDDLLRFEWVADPQISPDGSRIAFTRVAVDAEADQYVTSLWLADATRPGTPRRLTTGRLDSSPRWSPDGASLAFVRKTDKEKPAQIFVLPMHGGEAVQLTTLEGGASCPAWSPDGRALAFLSGTNPAIDTPERKKPPNEPGRVVTRPEFKMDNEGFLDLEHPDHVWVVAAAGGAARQLTTGRYRESEPRWSRDGRKILFLSDRRPEPWFDHEDASLYAVAADLAEASDGGAFELVADIRGPLRTYVEASDGAIFAIGGARGDTFRTYEHDHVLRFDGPWPRTSPTVLTHEFDNPVAEGLAGDQHPPRGGGSAPLALAHDGAAVLTVVSRHGAALLARVPLAGGAVETLTGDHQDVIYGTVSADGRRLALTVGDVTRPGDLYAFDAPSRTLVRLWGPNEALFAERSLGEVDRFWYDSFDGRKIHAWMVKPPDYDPSQAYPMILEIHGGPHAAYGEAFFHEFRVLAAAGYLVLYTNPRGSTSYGDEFANVIQYRFPDDDARDLLAGVDAAIARYKVDAARIGVTGGSGGGLLTNWLVAHSDRFAAAVTQRCVADWTSMWAGCDFTMFTPFWFKKGPHEDPKEYQDRSPLYLASNIQTPLMVIHSEEDWRTPIVQGESMFRALKMQRKETVMVRFPGEGHELSRSGAPSRRVQNQQHIRAWFDKHLMGTPAPQYEA
jgi:dipeptidyl aminopeptidase/acylaminoacyl peptidase